MSASFLIYINPISQFINIYINPDYQFVNISILAVSLSIYVNYDSLSTYVNPTVSSSTHVSIITVSLLIYINPVSQFVNVYLSCQSVY